MATVDALDMIVNDVVPEKRELAIQVATEAKWMLEKLEQAREHIADSDITIPYDNGGGQTGIRANPAYAEYERLFQTFNKAVQTLISMLPESKQEKAAKAGKLESLKSSIKVVSAC